MKKLLFASILSVIVSFSTLTFAKSKDVEGPADITCVVPKFGQLTCSGLAVKTSLTHFYQGALGGVNTKNADRINGLYDFDACYLLNAERSAGNNGDYILLGLSSQMAFGNGLSDSKVQSYFDINDGVKGYQDIYIDKAYVEFTFMDRALTFNIGKLGMKTYFDNNRVANKYQSQFFAYPLVQTANIPFPSKSLAVAARYAPDDSWYLHGAVSDGNGDKRESGFATTFRGESDLIALAEIGLRPKFWGKQGNYRFTIWYDNQDTDYLDGSGGKRCEDMGFALSFDQDLTDRFTGFFRYGWADDRTNEMEDFISFGGQIKEPIEGRQDDVFAVGYSNALRSPYGLSSDDKRQINMIETYYNIKVSDNVNISPNIQLVMNPGGKKYESTATVFGLRCRVRF